MSSIEDYAYYLLEEARSSLAALHQFRLLFDPQSDEHHFFFEGEEDGLFYLPEARRRLGSKRVYAYDCGGKRNVIEVRDSIKDESYDIEKCLFFVDRDYDDLLDTQVKIDENTYITDQYSIENEVPNQLSTEIILSDLVMVSQSDPEFNRIVITVNECMSMFYREICTLTGWILASKESGLRPNLRNTVGLKDIVHLHNGKPVLTSSGFAKFKKKVALEEKRPKIELVLGWTRKLRGLSDKKWVRGKYDVWFYKIALLYAIEATNSRRNAAGGKSVRIPGSVREGRFFEVLGGRLPIPSSLAEFYDNKIY